MICTRRSPRISRALVLLITAATAGSAPFVEATASAAESKDSTAVVQIEVAPDSDADEAAVLVNGKTIGPVPLALTLQPGRYLVEVSKPGRTTWRKWLDVRAGERQVLRASLEAIAAAQKPEESDKAEGGTLLVACDVLDAEVLLDGKSVGTVPALVESVAAGPHVVTLRAAGVERASEVTVRPGQTTRLSVSLGREVTASRERPTAARAKDPPPDPSGEQVDAVAPAEEPAPSVSATSEQRNAVAERDESAALEVATDPSGADIFVDGVSRGAAPLTVGRLAPGAHHIEARLLGMLPLQKIVTLAAGATERLALQLTQEPTAREGELVVNSAEPGADVYVNGKHVGQTPLRQRVLAGPHVVTVRREGREEFITTVDVRAEQPTRLDVTLEPVATGDGDQKPSDMADERVPEEVPDMGQIPQARATDLGLMGTYSAQLVQPSTVTADFSTGFPYLAEIRLTTGIADLGQLGVDAGVDLRTYGAMTEVGFRGRLRLLAEGPWSVAASLSLGGGGGPKGRNTFFVEAGGVASVLLMNRVNLSLRGTLNVYTDRHCPATPGPDDLAVCSEPPEGVSLDEVRSRFGGVRFIVGTVAELPLTRWLNIFGALEFAPFQANRRAFSDSYASIMPESDPGIYGRIGMTIKH